MQSLRTTLMGGVAALSLAATPALAQETTAPASDATTAEQMAQTGAMGRSYEDDYGDRFAEWGDRTVGELVGTDVVNDDGEMIGEVDDFGLAGEQLVAIVGIGGFLGLGEHSVAIPIDQLSTQGDQLLLAGVTREQLEAMPEYDEATTQSFAGDQTLRGGYEGDATDTAALSQSEGAPADQPMEETGEEMAEATDEAAETVAGAGEDVAEAADEATEPVTDQAGGTDMAETDAAEPATEETDMAETDAAEQPAGEETDMAASEQPMADDETETAEAEPMADEETETAQAEPMAGEEPTAAETETAEAEGGSGWTEEMESIFADIADREIAELIGMEVAGANGEVVGEVDNFALEGEDVVAIVGVGGFLGIGERDVALPLGDMTYDGERLVVSSMTEEQLREMPEYGGDEANRLPQEGTLRSTYSQ